MMRTHRVRQASANRRYVFVRQLDDRTDVRVIYAASDEEAILRMAAIYKLPVRDWQDARAQLVEMGFPIP